MMYTNGPHLIVSPGEKNAIYRSAEQEVDMHSLRISHESPGVSPGGETSNEQNFVFMTEMTQRREEMEKHIE